MKNYAGKYDQFVNFSTLDSRVLRSKIILTLPSNFVISFSCFFVAFPLHSKQHHCDLLLVAGISLNVYPAAGMV